MEGCSKLSIVPTLPSGNRTRLPSENVGLVILFTLEWARWESDPRLSTYKIEFLPLNYWPSGWNMPKGENRTHFTRSSLGRYDHISYLGASTSHFLLVYYCRGNQDLEVRSPRSSTLYALMPGEGVEPSTSGSRSRRSTAELPRQWG